MDWRPKMTVINWRNTEVSKGLLCFCPRMIKRNIFLLSILFLFAPPTPVVTSVSFTVYDTHNEGGQAKGCRASGGFAVNQDWH